ncbi:hypothetical protein [Pseudomonas sp. UMAB-40]|uniref:hypothetical protein n=1 Tax=Pseudomonas sp. UMAB-40 TaxID=1365407 RepID=UPI001C56482F|nr:hypothetical protein [Pseudomonas sp. UMAB-40]
MSAIEQIGDNRYSLKARGTSMVLEQVNGGWRVKTKNAATRAWSMGGESWKEFATLAQVEANYKSWRGIAALVETQNQQAH